MTDEMYERVPLPRGSYMFNLQFTKNGVRAAGLSFYMDVDVKQTLRSSADGD